jgi:hypothetical protein
LPLVLLLIFGIGRAASRAGGSPSWIPGIIASLGLVVTVFFGLFAALFILAGTQLLAKRRSGKTFGIVAACPTS